MSDDLIIRQAAIDMFQNLAYDDWNQGVSTTWANAYSEAAEMIRDLPSAQPEVIRCKDCKFAILTNHGEIIYAKAINMETGGITPFIEEVIPAQTEQKHGKWLNAEHAPNYLCYCTCSVCGKRQTIEIANYCPNCGAKMGGEQK